MLYSENTTSFAPLSQKCLTKSDTEIYFMVKGAKICQDQIRQIETRLIYSIHIILKHTILQNSGYFLLFTLSNGFSTVITLSCILNI